VLERGYEELVAKDESSSLRRRQDAVLAQGQGAGVDACGGSVAAGAAGADGSDAVERTVTASVLGDGARIWSITEAESFRDHHPAA
jgi:hypothetical protein